MTTTDVHQHLWPETFVEALRRRNRSPRLVGWTLHLDGERPYEVTPADHDPLARAALDPVERICLSLSAPLGVEQLPIEQSTPLLDAWHTGVAGLGAPFLGWASVSRVAPDLDALAGRLGGGFVGLQVPADALATPARLEQQADVLRVAEEHGCPVLVHPGPVARRGAAGAPAGDQPAGHRPAGNEPAWWPAVVDYTAQLQAAWWSWSVAGRTLLPDLRICFAAGAGLAPLGGERSVARGGPPVSPDRGCFVDTSSHGPLALRALVSVLGESALVLGSDRPYASPTDPQLGANVTTAIRSANPVRLLRSGETVPE